TLSRSTLDHNQALGGAGGADQNGSLGVGGGIFFFNFLGGVTADVSDSTIAHNDAIGGPGSAGGRGGDGLGGGIASGGLGAAFSAPGTVTASHTTIDSNLAQGGRGAPGGDGLGGGLYIRAHATLTVIAGTITQNRARGGKKTNAGDDGQGIGGGVYNLGTFSDDALTVIAKNHASTSDDDCFGCS